MLRQRILVPAMLAVLALTGLTVAQEFRLAGQSGANFLQIPVHAAEAGLGNAGVALADGPWGLSSNPAAIHRLGHDVPRLETQFDYVDWIIDTRLTAVGMTFRAGDTWTLGGQFIGLAMDEMDITTELQPGGTGETFAAGNMAGGLSAAMRLTDRFRFGGTVKWVHESIWETSTNTVAFDLGTSYQTDFYNLRIGMMIANFGADMRLGGDPIDTRLATEQPTEDEPFNPRGERLAEDYALPLYFNAGIALDPIDNEAHRLTVALAANDPNDNRTRGSVGLEYAFREGLFLRGGYKLGYDEEGLAAGLGITVPFFNSINSFDYAYAHMGRLEGVHMFSFRVSSLPRP